MLFTYAGLIVAAVLYEEASSGANHVSLVSRGAVDSIVDAEGDYFKLSMGSWINKSYVDILKGDTEWKNKVPRPPINQEITGNI